MLFFFFSSRRRHTRCSRDWSSDVCSSDLTCASQEPTIASHVQGIQEQRLTVPRACRDLSDWCSKSAIHCLMKPRHIGRSFVRTESIRDSRPDSCAPCTSCSRLSILVHHRQLFCRDPAPLTAT